MGSNHSQPVEVDPQALQAARKSWDSFTVAMQIVIGAIVVLLLGMAYFLV